MTIEVEHRAAAVRSWIKRNKIRTWEIEKIWGHITRCWPDLSEQDRTAIRDLSIEQEKERLK